MLVPCSTRPDFRNRNRAAEEGLVPWYKYASPALGRVPHSTRAPHVIGGEREAKKWPGEGRWNWNRLKKRPLNMLKQPKDIKGPFVHKLANKLYLAHCPTFNNNNM